MYFLDASVSNPRRRQLILYKSEETYLSRGIGTLTIDIHGLIKVAVPSEKTFRFFFNRFSRDFDPREADLFVAKLDAIEVPVEARRAGVYYIGNKEVYMKRKFGCIALKNMGGKTELLYSGLVDRLYPILNLVRDVVWFKLIRKEYTFLHSSSVELNGKCLLVTGWLGSGKTMVALKLVKEKGASFLADDLVIVGADGKAYAYPIPLKLSLAHASVFNVFPPGVLIKLHAGELLSKVPVIRRKVELVHYASIEEVIPGSQIASCADISYVFVIRKARNEYLKEIEKEDLVRVLVHQAMWERIFWVDRLFIQYAFSDPEFDLVRLSEEERRIVNNAISKAEVFEVGYKKYASESILNALDKLGL